MWRKSWAHIWEHRIRFLFVSWHRGEEGKRESSLWASYAEKLRREPEPTGASAGASQEPRKTFWCLREPRKGARAPAIFAGDTPIYLAIGKKRLQQCCKCLEKLFGVCNTVASASKNFLVFATPLQVSRKTFWCLQHRCKCHEKLFGVCNTVASASKNFLVFATPLQEPRKKFWDLQELCKCQVLKYETCRNSANAKS